MSQANRGPVPIDTSRVQRVVQRVKFGAVGGPPWSGRPVYVLGGGPSLAGYDLSNLRSLGLVLGVNRAADLVPVDATFTLDLHFMKQYAAQLEGWAKAGQEVYIAAPSDYPRDPIPGVTYLLRKPGEGCSRDPRVIVNGLNSGYGAVQLAILKGATTVYLLGFDMVDPAGGPKHWHDGYPWQAARGSVSVYRDWSRRFDDLARELPRGVEVLNANPESGIRAFPFTTYEAIGMALR